MRLCFCLFEVVKEDSPMTKHLYLCNFNNRLAYVLIGWDNNRKGFYMIFDYQNGCEEHAIFSTLFSKEPYPKTLGKYLDYLRTHNIELPQEMLDEVLRDSFRRAEDKEVTHLLSNGSYTSYEYIDYAIL